MAPNSMDGSTTTQHTVKYNHHGVACAKTCMLAVHTVYRCELDPPPLFP